MGPVKAFVIVASIMVFVVLFTAVVIQLDHYSRQTIQLKLDICELQQFARGSDVYHMQYSNGKRWIECTTNPDVGQ